MRTLYSDEITEKDRQHMEQFLLEEMKTVSEEMVNYYLLEDKQLQWDDLERVLREMFTKEECLIKGTCGRWNGTVKRGRVLSNVRQLQDFLKHLDEVEFIDDRGHLIIKGYHHDGYDEYELKILTKKGYNICETYNYDTIFNCNFYTKLPRIGDKL